MPEDTSFLELIQQVRAGNALAAEELLHRYEPAIRRTLRHRLRDARLCRVLDSMDICQSVFKSFFLRAALGRYDLDSPEDLLKLLTAMAHHKLTNEQKRYEAERRDLRRDAPQPAEEHEAIASGPSPSQYIAARELLARVQQELSAEERRLLELRQEGRAWAEVAILVGGTPEGVRKQYTRAIERVAQQLGFDEAVDE
jgi:RNA polymerase sigma-70 factor (ECF subfamily)